MYKDCCYSDRNMSMYDSRVIKNFDADRTGKEEDIIVTRFVRKICKVCGTKFKGKRVDTMQRVEARKSDDLKIQDTVKLDPKKVLAAAKSPKFGTRS